MFISCGSSKLSFHLLLATDLCMLAGFLCVSVQDRLSVEVSFVVGRGEGWLSHKVSSEQLSDLFTAAGSQTQDQAVVTKHVIEAVR